jgi:hypothetical protein
MAVVVNPKSFSIGDAAAVSQGVTGFNVLVGTASGGPYTVSSASVALSALSNGSGTFTGNWTLLSFSPALANFTTYYSVAEAVNAQGASGNSPEVSFSLAAAPSAPTSFTLA